ncbi:uncharacterized protein [Physcomitrium patens]|uniref:Uncharacterized protein n=1 Tax=Physcomitrium patens TaxID=3218 RepID=A0A2K1JXP8_PHYPA|nr:uncharacterized protein LOC112287913 [Physcomitrium patens]PNR46304.1 hypothetical protein PHYPA_013423 [Physcomitrium patens]|eukprot:XP_024387300.1 uncharacterized protein LOC112287913 [Physcomitrella patens]
MSSYTLSVSLPNRFSPHALETVGRESGGVHHDLQAPTAPLLDLDASQFVTTPSRHRRSNWNFLHIVCLYVLETLQTGVGTYLSFVLEILMPLKRCLRKQS